MIQSRFSTVRLLATGILIGIVAYQTSGSNGVGVPNDGGVSNDVGALNDGGTEGDDTNDASDPPASRTPATALAEGQDQALGSLRGRATFSGKAIPPRIVHVTKDVATCKKAGEPIEEILVSPEGRLAGVVIEIQGAKPPNHDWIWNEPQDGYVLRQTHCSFHPRLLVIKNGSNVKVYNDDVVTHNVNTGQWNVMQPSGADVIDKPIRARRPVRVGCNIHSWMEAWVYPAQSPLYCVTDEKGEFLIANVPPGTYRAVAWHPALRQQRLKVTIEAGKATTRDIEFPSPLK